MILSDRQIRKAIVQGDIVIEPFDEKALGTNSYDVHLGPVLKTYVIDPIAASYVGSPRRGMNSWFLDAKKEPEVMREEISTEAGKILYPGRLYLASTVEYTETKKHVPFLDGKSSIGRLGIFVHCTAGRGDVGFKNHWTLEIVVVHPVRVYASMPIGQLIYFETGDVDSDYSTKVGAKYRERSSEPMPSAMWHNFDVSPTK